MNTQNETAQKLDLYLEITNKIISLIEKGVAPWRRTWSTYGLARNYLTGNIYSGINLILLNNTEHDIPYFLTFNQVKKLNGFVKQGTKGEMVIYFSISFLDDEGNAIPDDKAKLILSKGEEVKIEKYIKYYTVFNVADITGIDFQFEQIALNENQKISLCEDILANMPNPPKIACVTSSKAYYDPIQDFINIPHIEQFNSSKAYYATLFHEVIHSTGHEMRLGREEVMNPKIFGSMSYSKEEMVAELGASFLCSQAMINYDEIVENNASYLKGWLDVLKEDKYFIFKVASTAQKACDYVLK